MDTGQTLRLTGEIGNVQEREDNEEGCRKKPAFSVKTRFRVDLVKGGLLISS